MKFLLLFLFTLLCLNAKEEYFYNSLIWKKVLHYKNDNFLITSPDFYLSQQNNLSLKDEYELSLNKLKSKEGLNYACKYPSRYFVIKSNTNNNIPNYDLSQCNELNNYFNDLNKDEIYLAFFGNLTNSLDSQFGHISLVFKNKNQTFDSSYEVEVLGETEDESLFEYIYSALTGKYKTIFKKEHFYKKLNSMVYINRHISLYKIKLDNFEKNLLIFNLFELKNTNSKYYYFDGNCTSAINDVLSLIDNTNNYEKNVIDIPQELSKIYANKINTIGFISENDYYHKFPIKRLSQSEKYAYLKAIMNFDKNYEAVNNISMYPYKEADSNYIINPSALELGFIKNDKEKSINFSYTYYDINLKSNYSNFDESTNLDLLKFDFNINNDSLILRNLDFINYNKTSYTSSLSFNGYIGLNRYNTNSNLLFNSEFSLGIPKKFENISFNLSSFIGFDDSELYLKPKINSEILLNTNNILELSFYKKFYLEEENYSNSKFSYIHNFNEFEIISSFTDTNSRYGKEYSLQLKYKF